MISTSNQIGKLSVMKYLILVPIIIEVTILGITPVKQVKIYLLYDILVLDAQ